MKIRDQAYSYYTMSEELPTWVFIFLLIDSSDASQISHSPLNFIYIIAVQAVKTVIPQTETLDILSLCCVF